MKPFKPLLKLLVIPFLFAITSLSSAQPSNNILKDLNSDYLTSAPPNESISYTFSSTNNLEGCTYNWTATNASNVPNGAVRSTQIPTFIYTWRNVNDNATINVTTSNCAIAENNGTSGSYSVPIRYLGQVGNITNFSNPLPCGSQVITFTASSATNATSYFWDYSNLIGWTYISGQGTTTLQMESSSNTGGNISITARRTGAPQVSTSSSVNVIRPSQPVPTITGPSTFCLGNTTTYEASGVLSGSTFTWSVPSNVQIISGQNTNQLSIQAQSRGSVAVGVTASSACGTASNTLTATAGAAVTGTYTAGFSTFPVLEGSNGITLDNFDPTCEIQINSPFADATYSWQVTSQSPSGASLSTFNGGRSATIFCNGGRQLSATCTVTTSCGSIECRFNAFNTSGGFGFAAYPNPANEELNIVAVKSEEGQATNDLGVAADQPVDDQDLVDIDATVRLSDKDSQIVREGKLKKGKIIFSVKGLPNGIYYLNMDDGKKQIKKQIIIQH